MSTVEEEPRLGVGIPKGDYETGIPEFVNLTNSAVSGVKELDEIFESPKDAKYEWVEECPIAGLFHVEGMWKKGDTKTLILNLSKEPDLNKYSEILNDSAKDDPSVLILDEQKQFCQTIENWKVLITVSEIFYRKLIK